MMHYHFSGVVYTVNVTVKRAPNSCANLQHFSTYDQSTDSYSWLPYEDAMYLVMTKSNKRNLMMLTVYLQYPIEANAKRIKETVRQIFNKELFLRVCGVSIYRIGEPQLFLRPHAFESTDNEEENIYSEKIFDMIIHS